MEYGTFRAIYDTLGSVQDRTKLLLDFAEDAMQTYPDRLTPLAEACRTGNLAEGNRNAAALCDRLLGWLAHDRADYPGALGHFDRAREIFAELGDTRGLLRALNGIASVRVGQGDLEMSLKVYREALTLAETLGDQSQMLILQANLGEALVELHRYSEAEIPLRNALAPGKFSPLNEALVLNQWARACFGLGREQEAREALHRSVALSKEQNYLSTMAYSLDFLGTMDMACGDLNQARIHLEGARQSATASGERSVEAKAAIHLGQLSGMNGNWEEARAWFQEAQTTARSIGAAAVEAEAWDGLYRTYRSLGAWKEALESHEIFHTLDQWLHSDQESRRVAQIRESQNRRETDLLKEQTRMLALVGDIGRRITASLNLETIMVTVYEAIGGLMKAEFFGLGILVEETQTIDYRLVIEEGVRVTPQETPADADSYSGWCIRNQKDLLVGNSQKEYLQYMGTPPPRFGLGDRICLSCLYTPLLAEGRVLGVLTAQCYDPDVYTDRDLATLKTLGTSIAVAIQNAGLYEQVRRIATVDDLTGAATRRYLFDRTEEEFRNFLRNGTPMALVMIDLDHFKQLNDTWGHSTGDRVLQAFGNLCLSRKRTHDIFGRYGGEEFAMVLSGSTVAGAVSVAERLCQDTRGLIVAADDGTEIRLTASFGITGFLPTDAAITAVFRRADEALYQAKHTGRDRVEVRP